MEEDTTPQQESKQLIFRNRSVGVVTVRLKGKHTIGCHGQVQEVNGRDTLREAIPVILKIFREVVSQVIRFIIVVKLHDFLITGNDTISNDYYFSLLVLCVCLLYTSPSPRDRG